MLLFRCSLPIKSSSILDLLSPLSYRSFSILFCVGYFIVNFSRDLVQNVLYTFYSLFLFVKISSDLKP